jgi:hypothetical protein
MAKKKYIESPEKMWQLFLEYGVEVSRYGDYVSICTRIRKNIRQDQIEGGMTGIYNTSITQRLNNLTEKHEVTHREQPLFGDDE